MTLFGRDVETAAIDRLLAGLRARRGGTLVLQGEAGIGKSALVDYAAGRAAGVRVLRRTGVEAESTLPFAGLHLLTHTFLDRIDGLPLVQAGALAQAFGRCAERSTEGLPVGMAVQSLLSALAANGPLLCLFDDAQWIDEASMGVLSFAARRLEAEPIGFVFATRDGDRMPDGLPRLHPRSLDDDAAEALLAHHAHDLVRQVRDRVIDEACGNPLALIAMSASLTAGQRAGGLAPVPPSMGMSLSPWIRRTLAGRIRKLPEPAQVLLLVAAADDTHEAGIVLAAARSLGASLRDLEPLEEQQLMWLVDGRLSFRRPFVRAAAYETAPLTRRLGVHRALAEALGDAGAHADRRAWHLAAAATAPDEAVAAELERCADRAREHDGHATATTAYERAAQLSRDSRLRAHRLCLAAVAAEDAGQPERAAALADQAARYGGDPVTRAEVAQVRASLAHEQGRSKAAHDLLVDATTPLALDAPDKAALIVFDAMSTAWASGDEALIAGTTDRLAALPRPNTPQRRALNHGAAGLSHMYLGRPAEGIRALTEMQAIMRKQTRSLGLRQRVSLGAWDFLIGDFQTSYELATALEHECRRQGAIGMLPQVLMRLARAQLHLGRPRDALASASEGLRLAEETSQRRYIGLLKSFLVQLAAMEGDDERCLRLAEEVITGDDPVSAGRCGAGLGLLDLGLGRYEAALGRLEEMGNGPAWHTIALYSLPDRVEAAVRLGRPARAYEPVPRFEAWAEHTGQPWAGAVALRRRALLAPDEDAETYYARAVRLHRKGTRPFERARTELLYGEWLRRNRRREDARRQLRSAAEIFERLGARPWTERARTELRAAGESRPAGGTDRLTPQETQVVRLAATGMSNRAIAARLFLSHRTVGFHLYKAFPKLGIASRRELPHLPPELIGPPD